jgi:microcystin-dependent protein
MGQPFVGEIRMFGGNFAPAGWNFCDGSTLAIADNDVLFNLIGTTYGGDGQTTFKVPDLRGRAPLHMGQGNGLQNYVIGEVLGQESVTITTQTMPAHPHSLMASADAAAQITGAGGVLAAPPSLAPYYAAPPDPTPLNPAALTAGPASGGQPHDNMQPFLAISFIISLFGIYPSQN